MELIIFARHGESEYNDTGRINADPEIENPLTVRGIEQAEQLGVALTQFEFEVCFTSELLRARQTAWVALKGTDVPTEVLPQLNEPAAGEFEGGPVDVYNDWVVEQGYAVPNPGGESQFNALRRFITAFELLLDRPESGALVVAHALPMAWLISALGPGGGEDELRIIRRSSQCAGSGWNLLPRCESHGSHWWAACDSDYCEHADLRPGGPWLSRGPASVCGAGPPPTPGTRYPDGRDRASGNWSERGGGTNRTGPPSSLRQPHAGLRGKILGQLQFREL